MVNKRQSSINLQITDINDCSTYSNDCSTYSNDCSHSNECSAQVNDSYISNTQLFSNSQDSNFSCTQLYSNSQLADNDSYNSHILTDRKYQRNTRSLTDSVIYQVTPISENISK